MKIDPKEIQQVAAVHAPRLDLYASIHKALRAFMADTLLAIGRMDSDDALDLAQSTQRVLELLEFCTSHLEHENQFIHTAIEARAPGASERLVYEHEEHRQSIAALAQSVASLRARAPGDRAAAALGLYRDLALFVAHNFEHMHEEETAHNAVLWAHYTDAELAEIHARLVGSVPPAEMMVVMRWMVPFMNPAERAEMLTDLRWNAPAPAFNAVLGTVRPHLTEREWSKLENALALPAAPRLVA
jgi:iron-sulfur cluster repair protein YtfE (RIC family)